MQYFYSPSIQKHLTPLAVAREFVISNLEVETQTISVFTTLSTDVCLAHKIIGVSIDITL